VRNFYNLLVVMAFLLAAPGLYGRREKYTSALKRWRRKVPAVGRRADYFALGTGFLVLIGILTSVNGNFFNAAVAQARSYSFWTAPEADICYVLTPVALYCFFAAFTNLPFPPWKRAIFPDLSIEINAVIPLQPSSDPSLGRWICFRMYVTNHQIDQVASIVVNYRAAVDYDADVNTGETIFDHEGGDPPEQFPNDRLATEFNLLPQHSITCNAIFHLSRYWASRMALPRRESLLFTDSSSGKAIYIPARTGRFNSKNWQLPVMGKDDYWAVYLPPSGPGEDAIEADARV